MKLKKYRSEGHSYIPFTKKMHMKFIAKCLYIRNALYRLTNKMNDRLNMIQTLDASYLRIKFLDLNAIIID